MFFVISFFVILFVAMIAIIASSLVAIASAKKQAKAIISKGYIDDIEQVTRTINLLNLIAAQNAEAQNLIHKLRALLLSKRG